MSRPGDEGGSRRPSMQDLTYQPFAPLNIAPQPSSAQRSSFSSGYQGSYPGSSVMGTGYPQQNIAPASPSSYQGKVAIPQLRAPKTADASRLSKKGRTSHACDPCRKAKAGCSGGQPCSRCRTTGAGCWYGDGKRDRERKELSKLTKETQSLLQQNAEVMASLQRIRDNSALSIDELRGAIDDLISERRQIGAQSTGFESSATISRANQSENENYEGRGEEDADAEVGSAGSLDVVEIDTDQQSTRGAGHLGKSSAVSWQHRTEEIAEKDPAVRVFTKSSGDNLHCYHTEDADMEYLDLSGIVAFEWPSPQVAGSLVQAYFDQVHNVYPILNKADFLHKFQSFQRGSTALSVDDINWLISLNSVFAMAAFHGQLMSNHQLGGPNDHLLYCARANLLCIQQEIYLNDARVSSTSALGLLALYYMATSRINRAWTICGLAMRQALALGLHVRSLADNLSDVQKEHRVRLWWALYTLECGLGEITGRPSCITDRDIGTPVPINVEEADLRAGFKSYETPEDVQSLQGSSEGRRRSRELRALRPAATYQMPKGFAEPQGSGSSSPRLSMTSSTFFIYRTRLCIIVHEVSTELYSAATIKGKWIEIENEMRKVEKKLNGWVETLPPELDVNFELPRHANHNDLHMSNRTGLAMLYNAAVMMLFRPCLCRLEDQMPHQSARSQSFNQRAASTCVEAARRTIALLSMYSSSGAELATITPFWNTLHCLCEVLSGLLLEMAMRCEHLPEQRDNIFQDIKKGVRWLIMLSGQSISARKAWETFDRLLRIVAPLNEQSVDDMPWQAPVPVGYNLFKSASAEHASSFGQSTSPSDPLSYAQAVPTHISQGFTQSLPAAQYSMAGNPLDGATAMERFLGMSQLHAQFDDPWQQHFVAPVSSANDLGMMMPMTSTIAPGADTTMGQSGSVSPRGFSQQIYPPGGGSMYQGHRGSFS